MTGLLSADPAAVRQAAAALDVTADEAARLGRQLDRQRPSCWSSPSHRDYVGQLTRLEQRVGRIARSHDEAAEVLAGYARALEEAQERARWAERLRNEGSRRSAEWSARQVVGPDPASGLLAAADRTLADAEALEREAAAVAAARLRDLAAAAPEQAWTSKVLRPLEDVGMTAVDGVRQAPAGFAAIAGSAWSAVPWVHGAREQEKGRAALADAAKVWEAWREAARDAVNGRPGLAAGAFVGGGGFLPRPRIKPDGYLAFTDERLLRVRDVGDAWDQAHAAKALQDRIVSLREVPLPGTEALLVGPVDLAHHEARGGHTILKHVAVRLVTLQARLDQETDDPTAFRSSFPDLVTAEELVGRALRQNAWRTRRFARRPSKHQLMFTVPLDEAVGTVLHKSGAVTSGRAVTVVLKKEAGQVYVHTAWLEP